MYPGEAEIMSKDIILRTLPGVLFTVSLKALNLPN